MESSSRMEEWDKISLVCSVKPYAIWKMLLPVCLYTITLHSKSAKGHWEAVELDLSPDLQKRMGPYIANCSPGIPFPCLVCFLKSSPAHIPLHWRLTPASLPSMSSDQKETGDYLSGCETNSSWQVSITVTKHRGKGTTTGDKKQ